MYDARAMTRPLRFLVPCHKSLFLASDRSAFGAQQFANNLLSYFKYTPHAPIGVVFGDKPERKSLRVKKTQRSGMDWLMLEINLSTPDIMQLAAGQADSETLKIVDDLALAFAQAKPDLFFLSGFSALSYILFKAAVKANIPVVTTHHGLWFRESESLQSITRYDLRLRRVMEKETVTQSVKNVFLTQASYRDFAKHICRVPKKQLAFITLPYNPVFATGLPKKKPAHPHPRIGFVGRWDPVKNHPGYLALAKEAARQGLDWEFSAVTEQTKVRSLSEIASEYKKYIEVLPQTTQKKLISYYRSLDLVVVPSHSETFCGVIMESMLQGTPALISSGVGWVDAYREYGLRKWIVNFQRPKRVIQRIKKTIGLQPPPAMVKKVTIDNSLCTVFAHYETLFTEVRDKYEGRATRL